MLKKKSMHEQIERMKYVSKYTINETPKYKSLVGDSGMDVLPEYLMKEAPAPADDPNAAPDAGGAPAAPDAGLPLPDAAPDAAGGDAGLPPMPDAPAGDSTAAAPAPAAAPAEPPQSNTNVDITTAQAPSTQPDAMGADPMGAAPIESPEKKVMELQLDALRKMSTNIEDLGATVDSLNQRMEMYSQEVEKVREPSNNEKFENRKNDSSPYYFNLNDLWKDDNFKARMDQYSKGYVKTEDGYVADFDDLPKLAPHEVKASFNGF